MKSPTSDVNPRQLNTLSVVIPAFNEELVITECITRIRNVLSATDIKYEILVVNDGSTDDTLGIIKGLKLSDGIRVINLTTNVGHMNALRAGLEASSGDYVVTIDADLQDPPEAIPEMFNIICTTGAAAEEKSNLNEVTWDVVQAFRVDRSKDTFWKRKTATGYYKVIKKITGISLVPHAADFRIMKRHVVEKLVSLPEKNLIYRLLIPSLGFRIVAFPIERGSRFAGTTKYTNLKMLSLAIDSVIGFTHRPLRLLAYAGISASVILFIGSIVTLLIYIFGNTLPGWPSLVLLILSFNAFLFAGLGLVGEYVGRIYQLVQNRPRIPWNEI